MWLFGYGSLMWKADFPYEKKIVGYVKGYVRRFYQESTDHRGTPEKPGRVVTLIPAGEEDRVYGIAYRIKESDIDDVLKYLDYREKGGYERVHRTFYPHESSIEPFEILIYIAHFDNKQYAGEADDEAIALQILESVGPSGPNTEYVYKLAEAMRIHAPHVSDEHLFTIEQKVLQLSSLRQRCDSG